MEKREFKPTQGLMEDVMTKQAGSVEKAILEGVTNSVDANANEVEVVVKKNEIIIQDDGEGITEEEVEEYFEKFGLKDDDIEDKTFGKFRMGRGQIFNFGINIWHTQDNILLVNLHGDETRTSVNGEDLEVDTSGLSYNFGQSDDYYDGCSINVDLYEKLEDIDQTVNEVKKLIEFIPWMHDVKITINGDEVYNEPEIYRETDLAYYIMEPSDVRGVNRWSSQTTIYNQGAFVKSQSLAEIKSVIISKVDLDVNFARNDILDNDPNWRSIQEQTVEAAKLWLTEEAASPSQRQRIWLLEQAVDDRELFEKIKSKRIIEDVKGQKWSIKELQEENISFSKTGNKIAEDMMDKTDTVILKEVFNGKLHELIEGASFLKYSEVIEDKNTFEMSEVKEEELSKKRRDRLKQARWLLREVGFSGDVTSGFSQHANVWKDDNNKLYIHKEVLKEKKTNFLTEALHEIVEVAAHSGDTREGRDHGMAFRRNYWDYMQLFPEAQKKLTKGSADY